MKDRHTIGLAASLLAFGLGCGSPARGPVAATADSAPARSCPGAYPTAATSPYVLPYPVGTSYRTGLGNCSGVFHAGGSPDQYATDFVMDVGSLITASRAGSVVYIEQSGHDGGHPNNFVAIDHGDGSIALYQHLTHQGALVKTGEHVAQGAPVGLSGFTGEAGYPHLHFIVILGRSVSYPYESIPVTFRNAADAERGLAGDTDYLAQPY